ncbi:hypothetical protein AT864_03080 [Anoxybacillus sp. P3H1B]|uniref:pPIWI_RE_Z domain-containing protein n=1 Tax=Anoxybacillus sp. P3H1B TaxID=1769293 RepID=UPI00079BAC82|nr:hypothetical protein [Anoxybacillus sp. P3H1B]KXG08663.1 hypothetical protein AT864_03080 [Anoxybacillus sp. P3H1B]
MRQSVYALTKDLRKQMSEYLGDKTLAKILVFTELFLFGVKEFAQEINVYDVWAITTKHGHPIIPNNLSERDYQIISRLQILFPYFRNRTLWQQNLQQYEMIDIKIRLFSIHDGYAVDQVPYILHKERLKLYTSILHQPLKKVETMESFAPFEKELCYIRKKGKREETYKFTIPLHFQTENVPRLCLYRPKMKVKLTENVSFEEIAKEMERISGKNWVNRAKQFTVTPFSSQKELSFYEVQHIAGGLGAGKSTFITLATYFLTKKKMMKVGIIESTVERVLDRVKQLRKLNIKAVPITGFSTQRVNLENQMRSFQNEIEDVSDWDAKDYELFGYLSGACIIQALAQDYEDEHNTNLPCQSILEGEKVRICPLYTKCGVHALSAQLAEAEVWVATSQSVLKSRIPKMADPYNRIYYEAMYDLLDVVFIDEADKAQQDFEEAFFTEYDLFGNSHSLYDQLEKIKNRYVLLSHMENNEVYKWTNHLAKLNQLILKVYNLLSRSFTLRKFLSDKLFHTYYLLMKIAEKIDVNGSGELFQKLKKYIDEPMEVDELVSIVDQLLRGDPTKETSRIIDHFLSRLVGKNKEDVGDDELLKRQVEFLLYLAQIDYYIKYLIQHFPSVREYLEIEADLNEFLRIQSRDLKPFVPETMTGMMIGYRFLPEENKFKFMEYIGVGRQLLSEWHNLYENPDHHEGPGIIFLSGTSYAPGSSHFHLPFKTKWLLTSNQPLPSIEQFYLPIISKETGEPIYISGTKDKQSKHFKLQMMTNALKNTFQNELKYWKEEDRRLLIVVNSYEDTEAVAQALQKDVYWKERFKVLTKDQQTEPYHFPKSLIEKFAYTNASLLVVPLSSIGREYNILQLRKNASLFGSVFFFIRPYIVPGDMNYMVQILHSFLPSFLQRVDYKGLQYGKAVGELKRMSIAKLEQMIKEPDFWNILEDKEREILSWFTFIQVWQMAGRLLRGGTNARLFYIDAKFAPNYLKGEKDTPRTSMLESWNSILTQQAADPIIQALYGPFIDSLNRLEKKMIHY